MTVHGGAWLQKKGGGAAPLQDTTQSAVHKQGSAPANRLRHAPHLVCNVEYSHLPNSARTELLHEGQTWRCVAAAASTSPLDCAHSRLHGEKCGLDLSLLLSVLPPPRVCADDSGYDGRGPPTGVAVRLLQPGEMAPPRGHIGVLQHMSVETAESITPPKAIIFFYLY